MKKTDSYSHILRYTGLFGGVQGLNILVGVVRNKLVAMILGPDGMGLISLFNSTLKLMSDSTNFGISISAVKSISEHFDKNEEEKLADTVKLVRSWSLLAGLLGMFLCIVLSPLLSKFTFSWDGHRLDRSIEYVKDKEKTTQKADSLEAAIDYAMNRTKTEQAVFEDTIGCTNENAYEDMLTTKKRFHKMGGVEGYHLVQSFAEGEVTPELAHLIGQELADRLLKGQYEVVITTHLNTRHYHNHIVWNSVSMADGRKYHSNAKSYYTEIRKISDELCRKYGLSIIESDQKKSIPYVQWKAEQEGKPTWRMAIRLDIRESVQESYSWLQFLKEMEKRGYTWKLNRKYISLKAPGMERYIRLRSLGKNYSEEEIRGQILQPKVKRVYQKAVQIHPKKKLTGIQALYYSYLYQMGVLPKRPKRSPYAVREDIRKLDRRIEQIEFLLKHDIITREQLAAYREPLQKQIAELMKERRRLYRNGGRETGEERLSEINEELKRLRKEVRMTVQIEKHSLEIEARLQEAEEQSQNEKRVEDKERMQKSQEMR